MVRDIAYSIWLLKGLANVKVEIVDTEIQAKDFISRWFPFTNRVYIEMSTEQCEIPWASYEHLFK